MKWKERNRGGENKSALNDLMRKDQDIEGERERENNKRSEGREEEGRREETGERR